MTSFGDARKWLGVLTMAALAAMAGCQENVPRSSAPSSSAQASVPPATSASTTETSAVPACTTGQDQTCNDNPALNSLHGKCTAAGTCECTAPFTKLSSGRCS